MNSKCVQCGSSKMISLAPVLDQGQNSDGHLKARVGYTNPDAWVFKGSVYAKLKANICGECGHTQLVAENPSALYDAYLRSKDHLA